MARGRLRVYLGAAPGVGKTFTMLGEGHRRVERGTDVVVAFVEDHGRPHTRDLVAGLEVVPRMSLTYRGATFDEMDVDAVLARRPEVALVDELAHTNVPGARNAKRWQDVDELLDAGIDVITTVNVQHLESLNDVVRTITGVEQRETVPDEVVRRADQIELVDMTPEALRRRLAHGNVYKPDKVDAALAHYFRVGNLTALRELALLWVADRVDEGLARYRAEQGIEQPWPARERVVVALTGGPEGETLIRRGARIAGRTAGRELLAVHVARSDGLTGASPDALARQRVLVESLGGTFHTVVGGDVAEALLDFARGVNATQLVVGMSRRRGLERLVGRGVGDDIVQGSGDIDVHIVTHEQAGRGGPGRRTRALSRGRTLAGWGLATIGPVVLAAVLYQLGARESLSLSSVLLLFLTLTVGVALVGGLWPALVGAVVSSLVLNWVFTPPYGTLTIAEAENILALVIFVVVAAAVASVVDLAARRTVQASRAQSEAATLSTLAGSVLSGGDEGVGPLLDRLRETFGLTSVTLLERHEHRAAWAVVASSGWPPCSEPGAGDGTVTVSDDLVLAINGRPLAASDQRVVGAYAARVGVLLERERLAALAAEADRLAEGNAVRTALLAAVSHDLRSPLSGIKAAVSSLRQDDVDWSPEDEAALLETIEESTDRLDALVGNLLDLSRLQTGSVQARQDLVDAEDLVTGALSGLPDRSRVSVEVADFLPLAATDGALVERVVANLVENALRYSAGPVVVALAAVGDRLEIRVVDRGPGVPDVAKERIFAPFQRLGDAPAGMGVGLGLAVARGLTEAVGGELAAEDTPGGGLTMVLALPVSPVSRTAPEAVR